MPATAETRQAIRRHPFVAAIQARDHPALVEMLAADVVLHAAVTSTPFEGRETVGDVYAAVIESFEEVEVVDEFASGDTHAFFWRGRIDGRFVEGADRFRVDGAGKVREITVTGRPLSGLATFITGIGARFAHRRRGPAVGRIMRLTARPLPPMFAGLDPVTRWLARPPRR
jgi:SnoaL-like domain